MHRRHFLQSSLFASAALLLRKNAGAAIRSNAPRAIRMLRNNVGIFTERGGTIGFCLSPEGIVVIDSQFPEQAGHFIEAVKNTQPQTAFHSLLNTHHHGDHSGGNPAFKGLVKQIVAHENAKANQQRVAESSGKLEQVLLPDATFKDDWRLKLGGENIKAYYFGPGHTNGDAIYHFEAANIAHLGDLLFNRRHPFVDRSAGASMTNWIQVLEQVQQKTNRNTQFIFGHSLRPGEETGTAEDLKLFQDYLDKVLRFAKAEFKAGKSKEEFIQNKTVPGVTEWAGDGLERPLTAAYEEVSTKPA